MKEVTRKTLIATAVPTGDWSRDNEAGRDQAERAIRHIQETGNPTILKHIVDALPSGTEGNGYRVGFFTRLSQTLI